MYPQYISVGIYSYVVEKKGTCHSTVREDLWYVSYRSVVSSLNCLRTVFSTTKLAVCILSFVCHKKKPYVATVREQKLLILGNWPRQYSYVDYLQTSLNTTITWAAPAAAWQQQCGGGRGTAAAWQQQGGQCGGSVEAAAALLQRGGGGGGSVAAAAVRRRRQQQQCSRQCGGSAVVAAALLHCSGGGSSAVVAAAAAAALRRRQHGGGGVLCLRLSKFI
jgi:hypothetical protein